MATLVQSYPQQSSTVTMLQTRPTSASEILQASSANTSHQYPTSASHKQRSSFHGLSNGSSSYRGQPATPIAPYAFTATPNLTSLPVQKMHGGPHLRSDQRTTSAPAGYTGESLNRSRYPAPASISTTSSTSSSERSAMSQKSGSKDDSSISSTSRLSTTSLASRPQSTMFTQPSSNLDRSSSKPTPDRYRRPNNRRVDSAPVVHTATPVNVSNLPNVMQFYGTNAAAPNSPNTNSPSGFKVQMPPLTKDSPNSSSPTVGVAADDLQINRHMSENQARRYRRRSIHTIEASNHTYEGLVGGLQMQGSRQVSSANGRIDHQQQHPLRSSPIMALRPGTSNGRNSSSESVHSIRSGPSSRPGSGTKRDPSIMANANPAPSSPSTSNNSIEQQPANKNELPRLINIPPRASSSDAAKRIANPSPLSKPMTMSPESKPSKDSFASTVSAALQAPNRPTYAQVANGSSSNSPAAKQLAALNDKENKKSKTSRLRRAFSFGSAVELRKAAGENSAASNTLDALSRSKVRKDKYLEEQDAEQARIAQQQEAGGIGSGIYNGQGNIFTGSTDNLSISSTASSASIMIRKMGKGMKKSTRSLVGLFRPKSVIGVPAADGPLPEASLAQVSMVTVEAEREKVNVNAKPTDQIGGGTGFPRLERNSIDTASATAALERLGSSSTDTEQARRSIVGGEKERAEVLAAVKKGILKRSGTDSGSSSPTIRPVSDAKSTNFQLPQIPKVNDSPLSSMPSTPDDQGHRRTGSVTLGGEDYFMSALSFRGDSKSVPTTPQAKRNATFSQRVQFHDTWPSGEYDRRGEIATCNRLTPMLAQQIKEELNTFKMEMEVHETSKIYTHFF
ncbi:hypothetical protein BJ878DRAFT_476617 [Calycina marina]|uniref:Protein BNI4 n=1 Tax=Calycina marina TaxID=1763456 RepID=A0A9P7ZB96_9HELO|nr:hypothetical protein BJ878DRAFT_476617 [Calycina marina]